MQEHDFKAAIAMWDDHTLSYNHASKHHETIRFALALADKVMNQEPTEAMRVAAIHDAMLLDGEYDAVFKSMIQQAAKECAE